mmetsp:Transcript_20017/g.50045  ORF Transcript_20017/g.50045 Transcript_20017/m.50045 type:complete len:308 (-) Transcript_20017:48-971(-)
MPRSPEDRFPQPGGRVLHRERGQGACFREGVPRRPRRHGGDVRPSRQAVGLHPQPLQERERGPLRQQRRSPSRSLAHLQGPPRRRRLRDGSARRLPRPPCGRGDCRGPALEPLLRGRQDPDAPPHLRRGRRLRGRHRGQRLADVQGRDHLPGVGRRAGAGRAQEDGAQGHYGPGVRRRGRLLVQALHVVPPQVAQDLLPLGAGCPAPPAPAPGGAGRRCCECVWVCGRSSSSTSWGNLGILPRDQGSWLLGGPLLGCPWQCFAANLRGGKAGSFDLTPGACTTPARWGSCAALGGAKGGSYGNEALS